MLWTFVPLARRRIRGEGPVRRDALARPPCRRAATHAHARKPRRADRGGERPAALGHLDDDEHARGGRLEDPLRWRARADVDNPKGYFELERIKSLEKETDKTYLREARGKAVKVISFLIKDLPDENDYRVLFMRRDLDEVLASQQKMIGRLASERPEARCRRDEGGVPQRHRARARAVPDAPELRAAARSATRTRSRTRPPRAAP